MIEYKNFDLYAGDTVDKQLVISFDGGEITNNDLHQEEFELTESLCSESQLVFGSCEASEVKFRISNVFTPLKGKWLTITEILNGDTENPLQIGKYKVYSDKPTADRSYRDVVAYDSMYDIINTDVASWYNSLTFPMQLKSFRDSFFDYFGIDQEEVALVNDAMTIEKTIEPSVLSGKDVLQSICQINGCFGHIGRDGKMQYVFLKRSIDGGLFPDTELYPSDKLFPVKESIRNNLYPYNNLYPSDDLIPVNSISSDSTYPQIITTIPKSAYIHCYYEDYIVKKIDKLIIRQEENDVGCTVGNGDNAYIIEDNFLVYGKSQEELTEIATNTLAVIEDIEYRPITDSEVLGNPCLEVGDAIRFYTRYEIVDSYILNRTLKGIQGLVDSYVSDGEEYQSEKVNDIQTDIKQLKGKSNTLERTLEETKSTIDNVESGLQSTITQTAEGIRSEVSKKYSTKEETKDVASTAESNAKNDTTEKLKSYSTTTEMHSAIDQKADSITLTVSKQITETKQYADKAASTAESNAKNDTTEKLKSYSTTTEMNSAIDQKADSITQTVASSQSKWSTVASDGTVIPISEYGYGLDGNITGSHYIFSDTLNAGDIYLDQKTGYGWKCTSISSIDEKRIALFGYRPAHTFSLITDELSSRIEQTAESITNEVSKTYATKNELGEYSTTEEMNSAITQTAESIVQTVAKSQKTYTELYMGEPVDISYYGYGSSDIEPSETEEYKYYLDQESGNLYQCLFMESAGEYKWKYLVTLDTIEDSVYTEIEQNAKEISLKVSKGDVSSQLSVESEQVTITGNRLVVESENFQLDGDGYARLGGEIEATSFSAYNSINLRGGLQPGWGDYSDWYKVLYLGQNPNVSADPYLRSIADIDFFEQITCVGTKSRVMNTDNYSGRLLYCYEMPSPFFGDIGHGVIGEDGLCYVDIESIFSETIDTVQEYYVFLTPYKTDKAMFIQEKERGYFIVQGEPGTGFDWEIKAKQVDYNVERLEQNILEDTNETDYEQEAINYLNEYEKELTEV